MVYEYDESLKEKVLKYRDDNADVTIEDLPINSISRLLLFIIGSMSLKKKWKIMSMKLKNWRKNWKKKTDALGILKKAKDLFESDH